MKFSKRLLCTLLAVLVTLTSIAVVPTAAAFTDLAETDNAYDAVNVLSKLGVINGYADGSFRPTNNVTRAEFTAMLLRTRGLGAVGSTSLENPPFPDVTTPDVSWAIGNIRTAREMGIINGYDDGTFKPNNNVLYEEAVKMIVCALGYGEMGADGAQWYSRYLMTATSLGFIEGAGGAVSVPATRATIANMLYNCLEVKLAEDNAITDKTILANDLGLTKNVGYIVATPKVSLIKADANLREDEIQIRIDEQGVGIYKVDDPSKYEDLVGCQIDFYYTLNRESNIKTLIMAKERKSQIVEISADLLEPDMSDLTTVSYYKSEDSEKATKLNISSNSTVVYNGKIFGPDEESSSYATYRLDKDMPTIGSIKLIDNNADGDYDVLFVEDYIAYVVSSSTSSNYTITDSVLRNGITNNKLVLDTTSSDEEVIILDKNGNSVGFNSITKGSVVCVKITNPDNNGTLMKTAVVCNDKVTGTVSATSTKTGVTINSKTYKYSKQAPWVNEIEGATVTLTSLSRGDSGTFYLDIDGNIIAYDKTESHSNQQYGYLTEIDESSESFEDESLRVNIVSLSGVVTTYEITDRTKINGDPIDSFDSVYEIFSGTAKPSTEYPGENIKNDTYAQLVKFTTTTSKGKTIIDELLTADATEDTETIDEENLYFYGVEGFTAAETCKFNKYSKYFEYTDEEDVTQKINIHSATMLKVPENRREYKSYRKLSVSDLDDKAGYKAEFYDVASGNSAKVVLIYSEVASAEEVKADSPVMVITEIDEGERYSLTGYIGTKKVGDYELSITDSDTVSVSENLEIGDVVRLGKDNEGYYTIKPEHVIFSTTEGQRDYIIEEKGAYPQLETVDGSSRNPDYQVVWGSAAELTDDLFFVSTEILEADDERGDEVQIERNKLNSAKLFVIKITGSKVEIDEPTDSVEDYIAGLDFYSAESEIAPSEIFIHMGYNFAVKTVIVIDRGE